MNCPICGKELEQQKKQAGVDENGSPVFHQYAICRDCKKQWNLDKKKVKKTSPKTEVSETAEQKPVEKAPARKTAAKTAAAKTQRVPAAEGAAQKTAKTAGQKASTGKAGTKNASQRPATEKSANAKSGAQRSAVQKSGAQKPASQKSGTQSSASQSAASKPAAKKRKAASKPVSEEQRYANIPPERVRVKKEKAVRQAYEDMLSVDEGKSSKKKKAAVKQTAEKPQRRQREVEIPDEPEMIEEDRARFSVFRIILGIISILVFAFFTYNGFMVGLASISSGDETTSGMTFIILAVCMLAAGLILLIMRNKSNIFAFLLPVVFTLASAVFAFLRRSENSMLLFCAIGCAVLALILLILTFASRGGGDEEDYDDYDDPFEDDFE